MIIDLEAAGWVQKGVTKYQDPTGALFRGPYGAWKEMKLRETMTTETVEAELNLQGVNQDIFDAPVAVESTALPVVFNLTEARIEQMRTECKGLVCSDKKTYETTRKALSVVRTARTEIEKRRKLLKADALEYGRRVDAMAKQLTEKVVSIEEPLKAEVERYEAEQARIKAEKEAAERAAIEAELKAQREKEEAERKAAQEAEEARLKALRDAEEARLAEERKALEAERVRLEELQRLENERIEAERAKLAEQQRIEQERIDAERKAEDERREKERAELQAYWDAKAAEQARIEAEQQAERERLQAIQDEIEAKRLEAERIENERLEAIRLEQEAAAKARAERIEAERLAKEQAERERAEWLRLEAMRPDAEKIRALAVNLRALAQPLMRGRSLVTVEAMEFIESVNTRLHDIATECERFGK